MIINERGSRPTVAALRSNLLGPVREIQPPKNNTAPCATAGAITMSVNNKLSTPRAFRAISGADHSNPPNTPSKRTARIWNPYVIFSIFGISDLSTIEQTKREVLYFARARVHEPSNRINTVNSDPSMDRISHELERLRSTFPKYHLIWAKSESP